MTESPTAVELFAGVGGFRLGLERSGWRVGWSNQWEPGTNVQHASRCYVHQFESVSRQTDPGAELKGVHVTDDITSVLDAVEAGWYELPDHELLTAGFPCQDYSVARAASQSNGIHGGKGVLWWRDRSTPAIPEVNGTTPAIHLPGECRSIAKVAAHEEGPRFRHHAGFAE